MELFGIEFGIGAQPPLDINFIPLNKFAESLYRRAISEKKDAPVVIEIQQNHGRNSIYHTFLYEDPAFPDANYFFLERTIKFLLWGRGGYCVNIYSDSSIASLVAKKMKEAYAPGGERAFDAKTMSDIYEQPFSVNFFPYAKAPFEDVKNASVVSLKKSGCRIGLDAGASALKVAALIDGESVHSVRIPWEPKTCKDPAYHYQKITDALKEAAGKLPRVDSVGISSAGVFIDNRAMISSLFLGLSKADFEESGKDMFINACKTLGNIPVTVANDGDVSAMIGALQLGDNGILGTSMGSSQAGGYVDKTGHITGWLNELAFVPVACGTSAAFDDWSGDFGTGSQYFSIDAMVRLAPLAGIALSDKLTQAEKAQEIQKLAEQGHQSALSIFETIGCYLGHTIPLYKHFYEDMKHIILLGGVLNGKGGEVIAETCKHILAAEYPECTVQICLPDEKQRGLGQSVAAAMIG